MFNLKRNIHTALRLSIWGLTLAIAIAVLGSCSSDGNEKSPVSDKSAKPVTDKCSDLPDFNRDSAYSFVQRQIDFGPRTPGSEAHAECADWFVDMFQSYGLQAEVQQFSATAYTGERFTGKNILSRIHPDNPKRILLCAHWDSRPIADADPDPANHDKPVPGANDGASGVAVLLELARVISEIREFPIGVDFVLFDLEDFGKSDGKNNAETWALGSQYWSHNRQGYRPEYGILLDMVGAKGAQFRKEAYSKAFAKTQVDKVWSLANLLGYSNYFLNEDSNPVTDDHYFVNTIAGIPTIDIIHQSPEGGFFPYWHTVDDDMEHISPRTLDAVGTVLLNLLCREAFDPSF